MTAKLTPLPVLRFFDADGLPLAFGKLYSYAAGTTTPQPTYTNVAGTVPNANPIILDANGECVCWLDDTLSYKLNLTDANGVQQPNFPQDGIKVKDATTTPGAGDLAFSAIGSYPDGTVGDKLQDFVCITDEPFGAACDGVTNDTAAVQAAINYCLSFTRPKTLRITGKCFVQSSLIINRLVDTAESDFRIVAEGEGAGFYTSGSITLFDSSLAYGAANAWGAFAPCSEFISFENVHFEAANASDSAFALSGKFLRVKFLNCRFQKMKCVSATTAYLQTWHFLGCNIRYCLGSPFVQGLGSFDVSFNHCLIENNTLLFKSIPLSPGGNSGFRLIDNVIEGVNVVAGTGTMQVTGCNGVAIIGNHIEQNINNDFNFAGAGANNAGIVIQGNFIVCDSGKTCFYHWTSTNVTSIGNVMLSTGANAGTMHGEVARITNFSTINDYVMGTGTITDTTLTTISSGFSNNGYIKTDRLAVGLNTSATERFRVLGYGSTSATTAANFLNSVGNQILGLRDDRNITMPALPVYANDAAAAAGGLPIGYLYKNGSVVQIRVT